MSHYWVFAVPLTEGDEMKTTVQIQSQDDRPHHHNNHNNVVTSLPNLSPNQVFFVIIAILNKHKMKYLTYSQNLFFAWALNEYRKGINTETVD